MRNSHGFDYNEATRDALAGIYVEVSDSGPDTWSAELPPRPESSVAAQVQQLFDFILSVDDNRIAEQSGPTSSASDPRRTNGCS